MQEAPIIQPSGNTWDPSRLSMDRRRPKAFLLIFRPRNIPTQVIRPYQYNFNSEFMSELMGHKGDLSAAVAKNGIITPNVLNSTILPSDHSAVIVNTAGLSTKFTFALTVDRPTQASVVRTTAVGYFQDEPFNPVMHGAAPTLNPNAIMVFTHKTAVDVTESYVPGGTKDNYQALGGVDLTPPEMGRQVTNYRPDDLTFSSPDSMSKHLERGYGEHGIRQFEPTTETLSNMSGRCHLTPTAYKSPKYAIRRVTGALDTASLLSGDSGVHGPMSSPLAGPDPQQQFYEVTASELRCDQVALDLGSPIDTSLPMSLKELTHRFPDMEVFPYKCGARSWDVRDQDITSPQNTFSYLVASTVSAVADSYGIADIAFRYDSWKDQQGMQHQAGKPEWCSTFSAMTDLQLKATISQFWHRLKDDLFPIIEMAAGPFVLFVHYNAAGQMLVNLHLLDHQSGNDGTFEGAGSLNGMTIPSITPTDLMTFNAGALMGLIDTLGTDTSNMDVTHFGSRDVSSHDIPLDGGAYEEPEYLKYRSREELQAMGEDIEDELPLGMENDGSDIFGRLPNTAPPPSAGPMFPI